MVGAEITGVLCSRTQTQGGCLNTCSPEKGNSRIEMSDFDFYKQAQAYHSLGPVIILGSGASAAYGLSGMAALAEHLVENVSIEGINPVELQQWGSFSLLLKKGVDIETALHRVRISEELTSRVVSKTWELLNPEDLQSFQTGLHNNTFYPLGQLIKAMFRSTLRKIDVITTNYDRLAEYACEQEGYHQYTGFSHGYLRRLAPSDYLECQRVVNIWKVHGSLDWFKRPEGDICAFGQLETIPEGYVPQIVTPGINKYSTTYHEPYRTTINNADQAIQQANSYLCVGFGFNDEHIQEKLVEKCVRENKKITVVTWALSDSARTFLFDSGVQNYLAIERGNNNQKSIIYSSEAESPITVDGDFWSLSRYTNLIL
jgi:hypothetical protein